MDSAQTTAGSVVGLWRYPVKSMLGEPLEVGEVTERGLLGDRAYALVDRETGKVVSAKQPRKWARLLHCRAAFPQPLRAGHPAPPVRITLPDGRVITSAQPDFEDVLADLLGRPVTITDSAPPDARRETYRPAIEGYNDEERVTDDAFGLAAPEGSLVDYAPLHLLTTATLARLKALYPEGQFEVARFRPNLLIDPASAEPGFVENAWVGQTLAIGDEVRVRIIDPCPRCVITTLPQEGLPGDPGILRTAAQHNAVPSETRAPGTLLRAVAGVYAAVLRGGMVRPGDPVRVVER